jgi:hypothetical protein
MLKRGEHSKFLPFAFTEQGVAMLSGVLNSPGAIQVNIAIMRACIHMEEKEKPPVRNPVGFKLQGKSI